ncbi:hypothetical protein F5Y16DRAFT_149332 [Xylariaceae sp. FL0255]|nr:hypothetical protein F5Y16DRAFT_149332 [Xylariaceae sp. FL0255]
MFFTPSTVLFWTGLILLLPTLTTGEPIPAQASVANTITVNPRSVTQTCCDTRCLYCGNQTCPIYSCPDFRFISCCSVMLGTTESGDTGYFNEHMERITFV